MNCRKECIVNINMTPKEIWMHLIPWVISDNDCSLLLELHKNMYRVGNLSIRYADIDDIADFKTALDNDLPNIINAYCFYHGL